NTHVQNTDTSKLTMVDKATKGHSRRKKKIPKYLRREPTEKEMDGFAKRVFKISLDTPFDEASYTHRLGMFFKETKKTYEDIEQLFNHLRGELKQKNILKKKSDPEKFLVPCLIKDHEFS